MKNKDLITKFVMLEVDNNHPWFFTIVGIIKILIAITFVVGVVFIWFNLDLAWKTIATSIASYIVHHFVTQGFVNYYIEEIKDKNRRK